MHAIFVNGAINLAPLYNRPHWPQGDYFVPPKIMEEYCSGTAFGNSPPYSTEEISNLWLDSRDIINEIHAQAPTKRKWAVLTAGAPGAGKTILLKQFLEAQRELGYVYAYICPDDVCLKGQKRTYAVDAESDPIAAYKKWRSASNAITHFALDEIMLSGYDLAFGTTSTGAASPKLYDYLKAYGYRILVLHVSAPDEVRVESIRQRDQTFVQTDAADITEKGKLLPQRINDTYLAYAHEIKFHYRDRVGGDAKLAAVWLRETKDSNSMGRLEIVSASHYENIKVLHDAVVDLLPKKPEELHWSASVEQRSMISTELSDGVYSRESNNHL